MTDNPQTAGMGNGITVWDVEREIVVDQRTAPSWAVKTVCFHPTQGHRLLTVDDQNTMTLWEYDPETLPPAAAMWNRATVTRTLKGVVAAHFAASGEKVVTIELDGLIKTWLMEDIRTREEGKLHGGPTK
jgi:WD40 repeat protein